MTRLDEIKKRLANITPTPWRVVKDSIQGCEKVAAQQGGIALHCYALDAKFIADAPSDVSLLLEAVERCRWIASEGAMSQTHKCWREMINEALVKLDEEVK